MYSFGPSLNLCKYKSREEILTTCHVIGVNNCINYDIDIDFTDDQKEFYKGCIINNYEYNIVDRENMLEGSCTVGTCYRSRLKGLSTIRNKKDTLFFNSEMKHATSYINSWRMNTSGYFICKVGDVDTFNRILVELYDPVTLESVNSKILDTYNTILESYKYGKY